MREEHGQIIEQMQRKIHAKSIWKKIITVLACMVVFGTTYALILPAITMDTKQSVINDEESVSNQEYESYAIENQEIQESQTEKIQQEEAQQTEKVRQTEEVRQEEKIKQEEVQQPENKEVQEERAKEKKHKMTYEGTDYTVQVTFDEKAALSEDVRLAVEEIRQNSPEYQTYYGKAEDALSEEHGLLFCRFFDVSFMKDGKEVEPADSVEVEISYKESIPQDEGVENSAIHFAEKGIEVLPAEVQKNPEGEDTFVFTQDSFSVVGTAVAAIELSDGSYIFYRDGYALGYIGGNVGSVEVTVDDNGYVYPKSKDYPISAITWRYQNGYFINEYLEKDTYSDGNMYLYLNERGVGLAATPQKLQARILNNTIRIAYIDSPYNSGEKGCYLGFDENSHQFTSVRSFANGAYLFGALVKDVESEVITKGDLEVKDDIKNSGHLIPELNIQGVQTATYTWYRSEKGKNNWEKVERKKITGDSYNIAEDGSWLNVPLDGGADKEYKIEIATVNGGQPTDKIESQPYHVPYYDQVQNGDFEQPEITYEEGIDPEHYQPLLPNGTAGMVWKTTAADEEIEFISTLPGDFQEYSYKWHNCENAAKGNQYVELNAGAAGALYQDVLTVPGATMYWSLAHRGRGTSDMPIGDPQSEDTMYVVIMSTKEAENITTQAEVDAVIANPTAYSAKIVSITDDNSKWVYHTGEYQVPEGQCLTRYFFAAGDTAFDRAKVQGIEPYTVGNHLDDIHFSTELAPPAPGKVNLEVDKTIIGLDENKAKALLNNLEFTIAGETKKGADFKNFTQNEDGSFTVSYQVQITIGANERSVTKTVSENLSTAEIEGYKRTRTTYSAEKNGALKEYSNSQNISVTIKNQGPGVVSFVNTYAPETVDISILKLNDETNPEALTGAEFSLETQDGADWKRVEANISVDSNGKADVKSLRYDQPYRLTETKAPEGYSMLTEPVYFKLKKVNGVTGMVPCDINGNEIQTWQKEIEVKADAPLQLRIINEKKAMLPETGGSGTKWIYMMGTIFIFTSTILYGCQKKKRQGRRRRF